MLTIADDTLSRAALQRPGFAHILTEIETPFPVRRHIYVHLGDRLAEPIRKVTPEPHGDL